MTAIDLGLADDDLVLVDVAMPCTQALLRAVVRAGKDGLVLAAWGPWEKRAKGRARNALERAGWIRTERRAAMRGRVEERIYLDAAGLERALGARRTALNAAGARLRAALRDAGADVEEVSP